MRDKQTTDDTRTIKRWTLTLAASMISILASDALLAQRPISIDMEARPSSDCMPASSLQIANLKHDFERLCPDCILSESTKQPARYRVIVEDPYLSWSVTVFDERGNLIHADEWSGGFDIGLKRTIRFLRQHAEAARDSIPCTNLPSAAEHLDGF